ncbi:MAG: hypothetical protein Q8L14_31765 [Myxococcales bacterium]|nr:hypothetical protein [Myxococcales bacterium]
MNRVGRRRAPLGGLRQTAPSERLLVTACAAALTPAWRFQPAASLQLAGRAATLVVTAALQPASHPTSP